MKNISFHKTFFYFRFAVFLLFVFGLSSCTEKDRSETPETDIRPSNFASPLDVSSLNIPDSIPEIVAHKDVIVIGTMGPSISKTIIAHPTDTEYPTSDPSIPLDVNDTSEPVTDFSFTPTDILLNDGEVDEEIPLIMRWNGHIDDVPTEMFGMVGWPQETRQYLLFLNKNSDESPSGTYSPLGGVYSAMLVDGTEVVYSNGNAVEYASGMTPSEFIEAVQIEIDSQY